MADEQHCFDFDPSEPGRPKSDLLYFALLPDPRTAERLYEIGTRLCMRHGLTGRLYSPDRLHLSLHPVGDYAGTPRAITSAALAAGAAVKAAKFPIRFDRLMSFRGGMPYPLVIRCGANLVSLDALRRKLAAAMAAAGLRVRVRSVFTPHVTLLRDTLSVPETFLDEPIDWTVGDFALVHSLYGRGEHRHIGRWQLSG